MKKMAKVSSDSYQYHEVQLYGLYKWWVKNEEGFGYPFLNKQTVYLREFRGNGRPTVNREVYFLLSKCWKSLQEFS